MLFLAVGLAVGAGALATILKPPPTAGPTVTATGSISVPVPTDATPPDPVVARDRLLEQLIADARSEPRPTLLPAYQALAIPCRRGQPTCDPVISRLGDDDVPLSLVTAFAGELRPSDRERLDALLLPLLRGSAEDRRALAIDLYREAGRAAVRNDPACGCGFGIAPTPLGEEAWFFAEAPAGGLAWAPVETEAGWSLGLTRHADGPARLLQAVAWTKLGAHIQGSEGGSVLRLSRTPAGGSDGNP
ncbi:MAG: hypothetical protein KDA24_15490 [Deltaproteobacteria bacterium]|nr:hypothetical protein [Deltaproteobacteria bacterium]